MPVVAAAAITAGATAYASSKASKASDKAANAQIDANNQALALEREQQQYARDQAAQQRTDLAPWREVGLGALKQLAGVHNITLPDSVYKSALPSAQAAAASPAASDPNAQWRNLLEDRPDVKAAADRYLATADRNSPWFAQHGLDRGAEGFAQWWYENDGRNEGYQLRQPEPSQAAQAAQPAAQATAQPQSAVGQQQDPQNRYAGFYASPDYQFRVDEGTRAITGNAAARGLLDSGATGAALMDYGQKAASQEFGSWYNRLANLAGVGQSAVNSSNAASQSAVNNNGQSVTAQGGLLQDNGATRASSYATQGGIQAGMINSVGSAVGGVLGNSGGFGVLGSILRGQGAQPYNPQTYTPPNPVIDERPTTWIPGLQANNIPTLWGSSV